MTYLSDTARVVLAAPAQRDDLSVLPFPDGVKAKGGAEQKVLTGLIKRGLVRVVETEGRPDRFVITREGMLAMNIEPDDGADGDEAPTEADAGAPTAEAGARERPRPRRRRPTRRPRRPPASRTPGPSPPRPARSEPAPSRRR